ncbi:hypothetical protein CLV58_113128 [Spirosoma oryzae]|uniref:Effector-associated domain-containing protein n=2 Tax=Spirosoma oryzae TaxID=1469603 RepID=A0A2T0SRG3_9BACT|nr:hypothetical protein CLV58_113128 [Spirosoma oryzae]
MASFLTAFTDRPSGIPAGIQMSPYISGMNHGTKFIFVRTITDYSASRGGMVFSHALIIDIHDLSFVNNLKHLFALFVTSKPEVFEKLQPISLPLMVDEHQSLPDSPTMDSQEIVAGLIENQSPVIFCGELPAFEEAIAAIWKGLPVSLRESLTFTVAFSPNNLDSKKKIVYVQPSLATAFRKTAVTGGKDKMIATNLTEVEKYILTRRAENDFESFIRTLQVSMSDWSILNPTVKAYQLYVKLKSDISPNEARLLLRLIARISPAPTSGSDIKNQVLEYVANSIRRGQDTNVKALKNLTLHEFHKGEILLGWSIKEFLLSMLTGKLVIDQQLILDLYRAVDSIPEANWWSELIAEILTIYSSSAEPSAIRVLWKLLGHIDAPIASILKRVPTDSATSDLLSTHLPLDLSKAAADNIALFIKPRNWFLLHAKLLLIARPLNIAVTEQYLLEFTSTDSLFIGTKFLVPKLSDTDLLELCKKFEDDIFISDYATRSVRSGVLLNPLDIHINVWLRIWAASLDKTKNLSHGIIDLSQKAADIFSELLKGKNIPVKILAMLAESEHSNLVDNKHREELWIKIPSPIRSRFINATAQAFLTRIAQGEKLSTPEQELVNEIRRDSVITQFLWNYRQRIDAVLNVYECIPGLRDNFLADYIARYTSPLYEGLSIHLGRVIATKTFTLSARQVFEKAKDDRSYHPALSVCRSLISIGFFEMIRHGHLLGRVVSESEIYSKLLEVTIRLYDRGPEENDIWKRAGGENSKLSNNFSREQNWRNAIEMLRSGSGGKHLTVKSLLRIMLEDHPNNSDLRELSNYFK